jgi:hypothetical protein
VKRGVITPNTPLLLGPDIGDGSFKAAAIKSIHYKVRQQHCGQQQAAAVDGIAASTALYQQQGLQNLHMPTGQDYLCMQLLLLLLSPRACPAHAQTCLGLNFCLLVCVASCCGLFLQRLPVGQVVAGQTAALALKKVKRAQVRNSSSSKLIWP